MWLPLTRRTTRKDVMKKNPPTPEQRAARNAKHRERDRARRAAMTPEQLEACRQAWREAKRRHRDRVKENPDRYGRSSRARTDMDPDERAHLRAKDRARYAALSPERREAKLMRQRARYAARTPEQRAARNEARRARAQKRKSASGL
ncbi:hypothetical protein [Cupriavidus sp. AcVe19-6a]|uniref:hypothetical protein n=1 Tax=Cupriavidus sp. AcVe19-6a TaxID=2821358 RepID=UPI001AE63914|nr:hypothetical protein [Cupriavidus sp. AcVe19-6a]MBP0635529.1 hypothetical protein [Cupriavidus sp. AcVe19-6a]